MTKIQKLIAHALASSGLVKSENARRERADSTERVTLRSELNAAAEALCDGAYLETLPEELRKRWAIEAAHEALENACDIAENADFFASFQKLTCARCSDATHRPLVPEQGSCARFVEQIEQGLQHLPDPWLKPSALLRPAFSPMPFLYLKPAWGTWCPLCRSVDQSA